MQTREDHEKRNGKKKKLLIILLYAATILFLFWLLLLLFLTFYFPKKIIEKETLPQKLPVLSDIAIESSKDFVNYPKGSGQIKSSPDAHRLIDNKQPSLISEEANRDEYKPSMDVLLKDRDFDKEGFNAVLKNLKSYKSREHNRHSTLGREVIYIGHTHNRESFLPYVKGVNDPQEAYHPQKNITVVGEMLERALKRRGIGAQANSADIVHELNSRGLDFTDSYAVSREHALSARKRNKDIEIFLDIHRDSLRKNSTTEVSNGESFAKLLFVVGTGHPNYESNLSFTEDLHSILTAEHPGLSKGILQKDSSQGNGIYNQDISPKSVIVEIGGVDNTIEELHRTTEKLADALSEYYWHGVALN